jgi:methylated-DNA-[protein]-cysteine S-methyltransferase
MSTRPSQTGPQFHVITSELGWIALAWNGERLIRVSFNHPSAAAAAASVSEVAAPVVDDADLPHWIADLTARLQRYAAGESVLFDDTPVDLSHLTEFQRRIVAACRRIRRGSVKSYGELAREIGSPRAARAVGNVMAQNRYPLVVPCHRVVGANSLGGFSAPEGLAIKLRMLEREGCDLGRHAKPAASRRAARRSPRPLLAS